MSELLDVNFISGGRPQIAGAWALVVKDSDSQHSKSLEIVPVQNGYSTVIEKLHEHSARTGLKIFEGALHLSQVLDVNYIRGGRESMAGSWALVVKTYDTAGHRPTEQLLETVPVETGYPFVIGKLREHAARTGLGIASQALNC